VPFTISHAAAVLPLRKLTRGCFPLAALMIGSMSPDFAFFLPGEPLRDRTHSIPGIFWFCWPVSMVVWLVFTRVLERPTFALLPDGWYAKFTPSSRELTFRTLALASTAVIIGAATHVLWDSFTHRGTPIVEALPGLRSVAFYYHGWRIRWFVVLQHLSTVAGMAILLIWAWRLPPTNTVPRALPPASHATRIRAVAFVIAATLAFAIVRYALNADLWLGRRLFHFAIGGMSGLVLAWLIIAVMITLREPRSNEV
jgi:uncharacterized protein DUF4184